MSKLLTIQELPDSVRYKAIKAIEELEADPSSISKMHWTRPGADNEIWCVHVKRDHRLIFSRPGGVKFIYLTAMTAHSYDDITANRRRARELFASLKRNRPAPSTSTMRDAIDSAFGQPKASLSQPPIPASPVGMNGLLAENPCAGISDEEFEMPAKAPPSDGVPAALSDRSIFNLVHEHYPDRRGSNKKFVLEVIAIFVDESGTGVATMSTTELAKMTGISNSQALRIKNDLVDEGVLLRSLDGDSPTAIGIFRIDVDKLKSMNRLGTQTATQCPPLSQPHATIPVPVTSAATALVEVQDREIDGASVKTVNARELHTFLGVGKDFSTWIKDRIGAYDFVEGRDFATFENLCPPTSGSAKARPQMRLEYSITLDMAKELSMVERNEKGKQVRQYFIECERRVKVAPPAPAAELSRMDILKMAMESEQRALILEAEKSALTAAAAEQQAKIGEQAGIIVDQAETIEIQEMEIADYQTKLQSFERICSTEGSVNLTLAATTLKQAPRRFNKWLAEKGWICGGRGKTPWRATADKVSAGYMVNVPFIGGSELARITAKGLERLAIMLGDEGMSRAA